MRSTVSIFAGALLLAAEASVRFTAPAWHPDLDISLPILADAVAMPFEMPRAESFLVSGGGRERRLEDRFDTFDLWLAHTLRGRWRDSSGNMFYLARITACPPQDTPGTVRTRSDFIARESRAGFNIRNLEQCSEAAMSASPVELMRPIRPRRSQRRNMVELFALPSTNDHAFAAIFRPRSPERKETTDWYFALLIAAEGEPLDEAFRRFDEDFLDNVSVPSARVRPPKESCGPDSGADGMSEADLLKAAVRQNVANYDDWHFASSEDVVIIDNLDLASRGNFIPALTNGLPRLRKAYAKCVPAAISTEGRIAVVRVFATRDDYLAYVGIEHKWTAALWDTTHRELVLYLPPDGTHELLQTVWHEAFHQYLAYAAALVTAAPWFNEGNAELFENSHLDRNGEVVFDVNNEAASYVNQHADELAALLPDIFCLDYEDFYSGTREDIAARYRLAWSLAYFLEVGAPNVRFRPFANLRRDYVKSLVDTRSADETGRIVFSGEIQDRFIAAWLAFWKHR